ncbi:hypothetical protein AB0F13_21075 [Streptomyces sp. NPDC026206]|uniref:hypothetical protein n=1 Tax=Streptomyces sp. NPDC026206 TaxID=3157089 RepID=UPI0033F0C3E0
MAKLAEPVGDIAPVAIASSAPVAGEAVRAAGYGRTEDEWVPDRLHSGTFAVDASGETTVGMTGAGNSAICKGDAWADAPAE